VTVNFSKFQSNTARCWWQRLLSGASRPAKTGGRTDFDKILAESVDEAIATVLGREATPELEHYLQAFLGLSYRNIDTIEILFSSLEREFGLYGSTVPKLIVKKMYAKANVPFYHVAGTPLIQYVYDLKRMLVSRRWLTKNPILGNQKQESEPRETAMAFDHPPESFA